MYIEAERGTLSEYDLRRALDLTDCLTDMERRDELRLRVSRFTAYSHLHIVLIIMALFLSHVYVQRSLFVVLISFFFVDILKKNLVGTLLPRGTVKYPVLSNMSSPTYNPSHYLGNVVPT